MKITVNKDKELVAEIRKRLKENDGYCPCVLEKSENTKCICKEFQNQQTAGYCHCGLYYKEEV